MTLITYKVLHLIGVIFVFAAVGGTTVRALSGTSDATSRKLTGMTHGIALLVLLVSGFGLLAKAEVGFPLWVLAKIGVWLLIGGSIAIVRKKPSWGVALWWLLPALGSVAAWLGLTKPF